jgi:8-oxo-dGTP pyrophosphatase MutT (NUDIX family)
MNERFIEQLKSRIDIGLPGITAQQKMSPVGRLMKVIDETDYPNSKKGAVLALFYPHQNDIYTVLIKRPDYEGVHGGQIGFPGGKMEERDVDASFTALREAKEEIGVNSEDIQIIGKLSNIYIPPSDFFVFPFLGFIKFHPEFISDKHEVAFLIEIPVRIILDTSIEGITEMFRNGKTEKVPYYQIGNHRVWGATAIILSELEHLLLDLQM